MATIQSWDALAQHAAATAARSPAVSAADPPWTSQALERRFGGPASALSRVTLYRDKFAWCPYCQKVLLWLEAKRIPHRIRKVTMRCYGAKEPWFTALVPSGMLPALELDGQLITESDDILAALEAAFGPLGAAPLASPPQLALRRLERRMFRAWCEWLCRSNAPAAEALRR